MIEAQTRRGFDWRDRILQAKVLFENQAWAFPLVLTVGIRLALTVWLAYTWTLIESNFPVDQVWQINQSHGFPIQSGTSGRALIDVWLRWDAVHFLNIAMYGYTPLHLNRYAFYPGYPFMVRWFSGFVPGSPASIIPFALSGLAVSTMATFAALVAFKNLVQDTFGSSDLTKLSLILFAVFPTSFFLFAPYSDAAFLALAISALLCMTRKKWILAGVLAALAGATRSQGITLVVPFACLILVEMYRERRLPPASKLIGLLLAPSGWLAYKFWMESQVADNLFQIYASGWNNSIADPFTVFFHTLSYAVTSGRPIVFLELFGVIVFGLTIVWMLFQPKFRASPVLVAYTITTMGALMVWDCVNCSGYMSILRYFLSLFPVFIGFAQLLLKVSPRMRRMVIFLSFTIMLLSSTLYACWVFIA